MKKLLMLAAVGMILCATVKVSANEIFWYNPTCGFNRFAKIVLFPLTNVWDAPNAYQLGGEGTYNFRLNSYVDDRLTKKLKKINFIRLANEIREKSDILTSLHGELLQPFPDEKSRAAAVEEKTMADMYIVPRFRERRVQEDISPRREWDIELKSWTEEKDGPDGDKTYDEKKRTVHHVIPETKIYLHRMQVEFTGYDKDANKILTSLQEDRRYGITEEEQFKHLVKDFQKSFLDAHKEKNSTNGAIRLGFAPISMPGEFANDVHFTNAMAYALQSSAMKKIKKVHIVPSSNSLNSTDYQIRSSVTHCKLVPVWHDPSYSISNDLVKTEKEKWKDKDGNEKELKRYYYDQHVVDYYAYWSFYWAISSNFQLVTPQNNVVLSQSYRESDDKLADAYRHNAEDFCKKVDSYLKNQSKTNTKK